MVRAVLIAMVVALALPSGADAARRQIPQGWLGVVVDGPLNEPGYAGAATEWDRLAGSGAESVRAAFYWSAVQPNGPADANFAAYDTLMLTAAARGLGVLPVIQGTPTWAARNPGDPGSPPRDPRTSPAS